MTVQEINQQVKELREMNKQLRNTAEAEKRAISADEMDIINKNIAKMSELNEERAMVIAELKSETPAQPKKEVSLRSAIQNAMRTGETIKVGIGQHETRAIDFDVTNNGGAANKLVPTVVMDILPALRNRMLLGQAGATYLTGLTGNINLPSYSGSTVGWAGENVEASNGGGTFSYLTLSPKRITSVIEVSRQLLLQAPAGLDQMLQNDLVEQISNKLEATILGKGAGSATEPKGIFSGAGAVAMSYEAVVALEEAADTANAVSDNAQYLMSTNAWSKAKTTPKSDSVVSGFILEADKTMNGYKANRSNNVAGIAFGDWSEVVIAQWGNVELIVDATTKASQDIVRIIVNSHWDAGVRRAGAIQAKTITA